MADYSYTPDHITNRSDLPENAVFVFGSNLAGKHMGGAAKVAKELATQEEERLYMNEIPDDTRAVMDIAGKMWNTPDAKEYSYDTLQESRDIWEREAYLKGTADLAERVKGHTHVIKDDKYRSDMDSEIDACLEEMGKEGA